MLVFSLTGLMLGNVPADRTAAVDDVRHLSTRHQYDAEYSQQARGGKVPVVMAVTAKRLRNIRPRKRDIREQLGDVEFLEATAEVIEIPRTPPGRQ